MPDPLQYIAKLFIISGIIISVLGVLLLLFRNIDVPFLGRLPGDIIIQKKNFTFYFPLTTGILLSVLVSLALYFFTRK